MPCECGALSVTPRLRIEPALRSILRQIKRRHPSAAVHLAADGARPRLTAQVRLADACPIRVRDEMELLEDWLRRTFPPTVIRLVDLSVSPAPPPGH